MKRLVSLTMAAACALSLAMPVLTASAASDSGYGTSLGKGTITDATEKPGSGNYKVSDVLDTNNIALPAALTGITVKASNTDTKASIVKKLADQIDKKVGYSAIVYYNSADGTWRELLQDATLIRDTELNPGEVVLEVSSNVTSDRGDAVAIEDMTLDNLFYNKASDRVDDIELFFSSSAKNDDDGVLPNKTAYLVVKGIYEKTSDLGIDVKAVEGGKYIKSIKDTSKSFGDGEILTDIRGNVATHPDVEFKGRFRVIEIKFKENMTDDEFKVVFDIKVRAKKAVNGWAIGQTKKFEDKAETWISNNLWDLGDGDWAAGQGGWMIQPLKNEENEIIWYDENKDIAKVEFYADSDTDKFFAKLSTKWNNEWYSDMFRNTDAFIFNFVGAPKISATSRATLTIYNPFVNDEDELEVDLDELKVYKVLDTAALAATTEEAIAEAIADGRIEDVTNLFTAGENEDGDQVLTTRTRDLGTYIVTTATPADLVDDVVIDSTNTGKVNPGTGR